MALGLALFADTYDLIFGAAGLETTSVIVFGQRLLSHFGVLLPFTGIAAGLRAAATDRRTVLVAALTVGVGSYLITAWATPVLEHVAVQGAATPIERPFGVPTPIGLLRQRAYVLQNPPEEYSLSVERPREIPPNWLLFCVWAPAAMACFGFLNVLLGKALAPATYHLNGRLRTAARWSFGLAVGWSFFVLISMAGAWVRGDPQRPGFLAAMLPLLLPGVLLLWLRTRGRSAERAGAAESGGR